MSINQADLSISGAFQGKNIKKFSMKNRCNEHATAYIEGVLENYNVEECLKIGNEPAFIKANDTILFAGRFETFNLVSRGKRIIYQVTLISSSKQMDEEKKNKSFQNINHTYESIIEEVASASHAGVICDMKKANPPMPLIQYDETDWEFIKRMASKFNKPVYPVINTTGAMLYVGMAKSGREAKFSEAEYTYGFSNLYYRRMKSYKAKTKADYMYYEVKSEKLYDIADFTSFKGAKYKICGKEAEIINGEVIFTYLLGNEGITGIEEYNNDMFSGMTLLGKVIQTDAETLKIHLNIDEKQDEETAYPYEWVPDTGSVMYCMPKVGSTVSLYFCGSSENTAKAVNCIRKNSSSCALMQNTQDRYLTTENKKQMFLKPESMGYEIEESKMKLNLEDAVGLSVKSGKKIIIHATGQVNVKAQKINVETLNELQLKQ
ncbi:hypothetical protein [Lachnotalea glycerini]|uniref:Late control gene D protein (GPD) n=1 Tax=Lachnotalea glycerini TaxID=1763509 RepID=A0A371JHN2_9FIRM|nr:hypothetical protein [Lachnotalea glycerini]RDY32216.1 hypothetical protein CG710_005925 [Lachnotalea glycerini]